MAKKLYRCRTETSVACDSPEFGRVMGPGQIVDLDETIGKNEKGRSVKLRDVVRLYCFEELAPKTKTIRVTKHLIPIEVPADKLEELGPAKENERKS